MTAVVFDDEPCSARSGGLAHVMNGFRCAECGQPTRHREAAASGPTAPTTQPGAVHAMPAAHGCACFACVHPNDDNAGVRVLHRLRHDDFTDWMGDQPVDPNAFVGPSSRAIVRMIDGEFSDLAPDDDAICRLPHHEMYPNHTTRSHG